MNENQLEKLKEKMKMSQEEFDKFKKTLLEAYLLAVYNNKKNLINKTKDAIPDDVKESIKGFMNLNKENIKYYSKENLEEYKLGGDMILSIIPFERREEHKKMTDKNFKWDYLKNCVSRKYRGLQTPIFFV